MNMNDEKIKRLLWARLNKDAKCARACGMKPSVFIPYHTGISDVYFDLFGLMPDYSEYCRWIEEMGKTKKVIVKNIPAFKIQTLKKRK